MKSTAAMIIIATLSLCESRQGKGGECSYIITGSLYECRQGRERGVVVILYCSD